MTLLTRRHTYRSERRSSPRCSQRILKPHGVKIGKPLWSAVTCHRFPFPLRLAMDTTL